MTSAYLPTCCYYPSTVLMVDDNVDLLLELSLALSPHYKSKYSTSPQEILNWLKQQGNTTAELVKKWVSTPEDQVDLSKTSVNIDIASIQQLLYAKPLRFEQHLVMIVDYAMPEMQGLDLAKMIRQQLQLPIKIIMLTGEADQTTAISAFNHKLIDRFIVKSAPDYIEKLLLYIKELHGEYFNDVTNLMMGATASSERHDAELVKVFNQIAIEAKAIEYYLLEEPASYLLLDDKKNPVWFIVKSEEEMQTLYELANDERDAPPETVEALKQRKKLVFFPNEKSKLAPAKQWRLYDATLLPGKQKYYYATIKKNLDANFESNKIVSYEQFLNS
jgi:CheY-like chemotaxis protein